MNRKGINYDVGFALVANRLSRESFNPNQVRREMAVIAHDLHCTAVRISGRDPARIALAVECALAEGLEAWFSPFPTDMSPDELVPYFALCAQLAEQLRKESPGVGFVLGCEMSLFNSGFVPGATYVDRIQAMMNPALLAEQPISPEELEQQFQTFLGRAVAEVRNCFAGPLTYASGTWENIDWSIFDLAGIDHYQDAGNRDAYREQLRTYFAHGRPVLVTEFGCCTYGGASDRGALGWAIVDRAARPPRLTESVVRDEQEQADYLKEMVDLLEEEGVAGAFWFTFAGFENPYHADPRYDLDCASFGVVKMLDGATGDAYPDMPWEPKQSFHALAAAYGRST